MTLRRLESIDGNCPYCESTNTIFRGGDNHTGKQLKVCEECEKWFYAGPYKKDEEIISFSLYRNRFKFGSIINQFFDLKEGNHVSFKINGGMIEIDFTDKNNFNKLKSYQKKTLELTNESLADVFRFEFDGFEEGLPQPLNFYLKGNTIMGLIKKNSIREKKNRKFTSYSQDCFLGIRRNGITSISAFLRGILDIERGNYVSLYKDGDKIYVLKGGDQESGFRIGSMGAEGFSDSLMISSSLFASFIIKEFELEKGVSMRIYVSKTPVEKDGYSLYQILKPEL